MPPVSTEAVNKAKDGDITGLLRSGAREQAFERLLGRYESKVFRLCCALLRNTARAQDAAQESWIRIWKAMDSYDGRAAWSTWLYTIARNRCLTAIERHRQLDSLSDEAVELEADSVSAQQPVSVSDDRHAVLAELIQSLPERLRRPLLLFYYEERSVSEVSDMLGFPEGTIKSLLFRARAALATRLRDLGMHDPGLWLEASE
jgi:RNA polymerase sigma-70 factor, ECF subfamily